jgi:two-component system chemotaxis response regulator CheB
MEIKFGELLRQTSESMEFKLPAKSILLWRESSPPEAVLVKDQSEIPKIWLLDKVTPIKILGMLTSIREIYKTLVFPPGSKLIDLDPEAIIQMNLHEGKIRFMGKRKKRVLVVDDSFTIRKRLKHTINSFDGWEVVCEASKAEDIPKALDEYHPDLITLDLHLGEIDGVMAMKRFLGLRKFPTLLITSQSIKNGGLVMDALGAGALDYLQKPEASGWEDMADELLIKMETALKSKWLPPTPEVSSQITNKDFQFDPTNFLIAIGSSTGGTHALQEILTRMPENIPPIIITQHIPAGFSKSLAERLNKLCPFEVKEAESGDLICVNRVLIAPGDHHLVLSKNGKSVNVISGEPVNRFRPSVEVMFRSVLSNCKAQVVAVMLTGMGNDGALAMLGLKENGAFTIAQDEATSVVFGMPREAINIGAATYVKPLTVIPTFILELCENKSSGKIRKII